MVGSGIEQDKLDLKELKEYRNFATRKNPRYYKSFSVPQNDEDHIEIKNDDQSRVQSDATSKLNPVENNT